MGGKKDSLSPEIDKALSRKTYKKDWKFADNFYESVQPDSAITHELFPRLIYAGIEQGRLKERERIATALGMDVTELAARIVEVEAK